MSIPSMNPQYNQFSKSDRTSDPEVNLFPPYLKDCENELKKYLAFIELRILKEPIGKGANECVYALADVKTGKISNVLKTLTINNNTGYFDRMKGAHLVENLQHPGICGPTKIFYLTSSISTSSIPTYTISSIPKYGSRYFAMIIPYIEGSTFDQQCKKIAKQSELIFDFGLLLANAMRELLKNQVSHSDLRSKNIMLDRNLKPIIVDFDFCHKNKFATMDDYGNFKDHLSILINDSADINLKAKQFILACLEKSDSRLFNVKISDLPEMMITFMQACIDHLDEIKQNPVHQVSKL